MDWLKQEPCEDSISRQAALDCLTATKLKKFDFILHAREEIKKLPPVNPIKTGHCNSCKWYDEDRIYNPNCENCCRNYKDNYCCAKMGVSE